MIFDIFCDYIYELAEQIVWVSEIRVGTRQKYRIPKVNLGIVFFCFLKFANMLSGLKKITKSIQEV